MHAGLAFTYFFGNNNSSEKFCLVLKLMFNITVADVFLDEKITKNETIMTIRGVLYALGADKVGSVHDDPEDVRGRIVAKAFPEAVPLIQQDLKEDLPESQKQKKIAEFQAKWLSSTKKKKREQEKKCLADGMDGMDALVNDSETPRVKRRKTAPAPKAAEDSTAAAAAIIDSGDSIVAD